MRAVYIICSIHKGTKTASAKRYHPLKTAVIIGSGGHTTEILKLLQNLNSVNYSPRIYIMASTDTSSEVKIHKTEETCFSHNGLNSYEIVKIPRSRSVGQMYISSVFTTLFALLVSLPIMLKKRPEVIICNGPGTCIPICVIAFMMRVLYITDTKIVFVESICRVKTLSLSGKILLLFADIVLVQWPKLKERYRRTTFIGRLT
ncbi:UDP-N-acetylglucosamine transferase subunit ALG14 homolog [Cryptotermes secundus]|nr:UDP-N-acetylglucosamine transferase subunit ALG14 homolog [Cryptotermes secundus]XP_023715676.1 UDP-N-acetylglucosamine transferase subunit ALG14 homolog [Cryptotermes secundus]